MGKPAMPAMFLSLCLSLFLSVSLCFSLFLSVSLCLLSFSLFPVGTLPCVGVQFQT